MEYHRNDMHHMTTLISTNPSRNYEEIGRVEASTEAEVRDAIARARAAFPDWAGLCVADRCAQVGSFVEVVKRRRDEIAALIAMETGRPITSAYVNVDGGIRYLEAYIGMAEKHLSPYVSYETEAEIHRVVREPRGVVAAILPWNYPFMNVAWQCGQSLLSGNTIVYKNSEEDPLFGKLLSELVAESAIPDGVLTVVHGDGGVGAFLVRQNIDMISFTGSTEVGMALTRIAAEKFIPIVTELGGSSPMIVLADAEVTDELVAYIAGRRFKNAGQSCDAVKRLIVHKSLFDGLSEKLAALVRTWKIGDALDEATGIGPLVAERQVAKLEGQVADAVDRGATVHTGGKRPVDLLGAYYEPTILTRVTTDMRVWREETFGPVLPIVSFSTEDEAVVLANDTEYGLGAHIMTADKERFLRLARRIPAGSVSHNMVGYWNPNNPFGGYRHSGMGRTHGPSGFHEATQVKVISMEK